jgi:hypothetical protein
MAALRRRAAIGLLARGEGMAVVAAANGAAHPLAGGEDEDPAAELLETGCTAIRDFLPAGPFAALKAAAERALDTDSGEPARLSPDGCDPGEETALHRVLPGAALGEQARMLAADPRLARLSRHVVGRPPDPESLALRLAVAGDVPELAALQPSVHRDSFHPAFRFWLTLAPVGAAEGPPLYVPGTHRPDAARLDWEQRIADRLACLQGWAPNKAGNFRLTDAELESLGAREKRVFQVPENTLVAFDTLGFHGRARGLPGARFLAVEGASAPAPFSPFPG